MFCQSVVDFAIFGNGRRAANFVRHSVVMILTCLVHVPFEGPAKIQDWAEDRKVGLETAQIYRGHPLPETESCQGVVIMGGPMGANDELRYPWIVEEKRFVNDCIDSHIPVFGVCLGAQLVAAALGARVYKNRDAEIGWFPVTRAEEAAGLELSSKLPSKMTPFHWHGDTFDLPAGAVRLYSSEGCLNQAFLCGQSVLGLQFHLESTLESIKLLTEHCREEIGEGRFIQPEERLADESMCGATHSVLYGLLDMIFGGEGNS